MLRMHKLITGYEQTDHINHDGLNNQRSNLRLATHAQNQRNQRPYLGRTSPYKGVHWFPSREKWRAQIVIANHERHIGLFGAEEDAARAYDAAAREHFGEYACLNFPDERQAADRWATQSPTRENRPITYDGQTMRLSEWAESLGVSAKTLRSRLARHWTVERAFTAPVQD